MSLAKGTLKGLGAFLVLGVPSVTGLYFTSQETVYERLRDDVLPDNDSFKAEWKLAQDVSKKRSNSHGVEDIKSTFDSDSEGTKLRDWCREQYRKTFSGLFQFKSISLKKSVKTNCKLTIRNKLGEKNYLSVEENKDEESYKNNLKVLRENSPSLKISDSSLLNIKTKTPSENDDWKLLQKWCKSVYPKSYIDHNAERYLSAKVLCVKNPKTVTS